MPDIGGMIIPRFGSEGEVSGKESSAQLGHQLFAGIAFLSEAHPPEITINARLVPGPVGQLMGRVAAWLSAFRNAGKGGILT